MIPRVLSQHQHFAPPYPDGALANMVQTDAAFLAFSPQREFGDLAEACALVESDEFVEPSLMLGRISGGGFGSRHSILPFSKRKIAEQNEQINIE
jgi:hypothetical protein